MFGARGARAAAEIAGPLLLAAAPDLDGPYRRTALVAAPMGDKHVGFILNRASEVRLATLFPDFAPAAKVIDRAIEQSPGEARFFAGFVGWMPGELEQELEEGCWHVAEPDAAFLFRRDTATLWEDLLKKADATRA